MKNPLVIRLSKKYELAINWKGYICAFRGDHYPINFTTLKCEICGKQFRIIPMEEYLGKMEKLTKSREEKC